MSRLKLAYHMSSLHLSPAARLWLEAQTMAKEPLLPVAGFQDGGLIIGVPPGDDYSEGVPFDLHGPFVEAMLTAYDFILFDRHGALIDTLPAWPEPTEDDGEGLTDEEKAAMAYAGKLADGEVSDGEIFQTIREVLQSPAEFDGTIHPEDAQPLEVPWITGMGVTKLLHRANVDEALINLIAGRLSDGARAKIELHRLKARPQVTDHGPKPSDRNFLLWIRDRLTLEFKDNPNMDFIWKLEAIAMALPEDQYTPNIMGEHPDSPDRVVKAADLDELIEAAKALIDGVGEEFLHRVSVAERLEAAIERFQN